MTGRIHYVPAEPGAYVVELRDGSTRACIGRVVRFGNRWAALGVGAPLWTYYAKTRHEAVQQMRLGKYHTRP